MDGTATHSDVTETADISENEQRIREKPPVRWHMYHTLIAWVAGPVALAAYFAALAVGVPEGVLAWTVLLPVGGAAVGTGFASLWAYYTDASALKETGAGYRPWWPVWMVAAFVAGTVFIAPLYLLRRRLAVGAADYSGSYLEVLFER